ncbi:MAG: hypothetical protein CL768_04295 [Chloroflexi bacterium]|nr:hypothetical protein [Chloroflexota bacterium]
MAHIIDLWHNDIEMNSLPDKIQYNHSLSPPYVSFNTFKTLLDWLKVEGVPLRLDRSFWHDKFSGSTGSQLMASLRFLKLIEGNNPLPELENLIQANFDKKTLILKALIQNSYNFVHFEELHRATPAILVSWFKTYPIDGHTLRKAISFFISASIEAELPLSNSIKKMSKYRSKSKSLETGPKAPQTNPATHFLSTDISSIKSSESNINQSTINLKSGGSLNLSIDVNLFHLSEIDRKFVLSVIDLVKNYEFSSNT